MDKTITIVTETNEQLHRLRTWLADDDELGGRLSMSDRPPQAGELGIGAEALLAVLAPGGVAVTLVGGVIAWLRSRTSPVRVRLVRSDGAEVEIETTVTGRISAAQLPTLVDGLATWVEGGQLGPIATGMLPQSPPAEPAGNKDGRAG